MNLNLFRMSMVQNRKSLLYWTLSVCGLMGLSMAFYPAISVNLMQFEGLFNAPVMKTVLRIFAMGPEEMGTLPGFYATYASVYMMLIAAFFGTFSAMGEMAGEMRDGTLEFLLTRPLGRGTILFTKWLAVETRLLVFSAALCLTIIFSFGLLEDQAPLVYWGGAADVESFLGEARKAPGGIGRVWELDDAFFEDWLLSNIREEIQSNPEGMESLPFSGEALQELLKKLTESPEALLEDLKVNPQKYMELLQIPLSEKASFEAKVQETLSEYEAVKLRYAEDPAFHYEMLSASPEFFLKRIKTAEQRESLAQSFPKARQSIERMLAPFRKLAILRLHGHIFLFMSVMVSLGFLISLTARRHRTASGLSMGLILAFYFISTLSKISQDYNWIGWASPFGLVDMNMTSVEGAFLSKKAAILIFESMLAMGASFWIFRKKDIL